MIITTQNDNLTAPFRRVFSDSDSLVIYNISSAEK
jgi:hypothetical protein